MTHLSLHDQDGSSGGASDQDTLPPLPHPGAAPWPMALPYQFPVPHPYDLPQPFHGGPGAGSAGSQHSGEYRWRHLMLGFMEYSLRSCRKNDFWLSFCGGKSTNSNHSFCLQQLYWFQIYQIYFAVFHVSSNFLNDTKRDLRFRTTSDYLGKKILLPDTLKLPPPSVSFCVFKM